MLSIRSAAILTALLLVSLASSCTSKTPSMKNMNTEIKRPKDHFPVGVKPRDFT
jgi:hypothetical protein